MSTQSNTIEQVRRRLEAQRSELLVRQSRVGRDLARRNEPLVADSDDRAIQVQNDEPLQEIGAAAGQDIQAIDEALERLALGLYGVCKHCGKKIPSARLEAVPHAVTCTSCRKY
jgi:RNA polymerase-binding transcription factor DksA